ncbi:MAG: hypothetical protein NZ580_06645 [Bacteroidia bacterium]|nr:hypothetical protein [Bacteroidia bacterium]MDW8236397.1 hypothetical protein [Bacteroidia bacterium]
MKRWLWLTLLWAQDPRQPIQLFRMGKYDEAYLQFKRIFERTKDYLWGTYAVECLLQTGKKADFQRWLQEERVRGKLTPWGMAWSLRERLLAKDTLTEKEWRHLLERPDLPLHLVESLAEAAARVWGLLEWQRIALQAARQRNPHPTAYAEVLITSYEQDNELSPAWAEWILLWKNQRVSTDTLAEVLQRYLGLGLTPEEAEGPLLETWQEIPQGAVARLLTRLYILSENYPEALRYARAVGRLEQDCSALYEVGWHAHEKGLFSLAAEALRAVVLTGERCRYYSSALSRYMEVEALLRNPQRVLVVLDSLLQRKEPNPSLLLEKAHWLLRTGNPDSVLPLLSPFQPSTPAHTAQKYLLLSEAALRKGDYLQSRFYLLEAESQLPQSSWLSEIYYQLARLAYFQGEFELAQTRLRLLKNNTQDELSNDAIQLFWHIEDNLRPDTLVEPLKLYAAAELAFLQQRYAEGLALLDTIEKHYRGHPITDDLLWQKSRYFLSRGDTTQAKIFLEVLADYPDPESLYRDDALYELAQLSSDPQKARKYYERLLQAVPGSLYARIAREKLQQWAR